MDFFKVSFLTSIKAFKNKALTFIFVLTMTVLFSGVIVVMQENIFSTGQKPQVLNLALVNEDDSEKTRLLLKVAQNTKEFKSTINLVYCEKLDTATNMLQKGEVSGVAVLPKGFLDSVLVGENLSPTLFTSTASPLETLCIKTLADSLVKTLSSAQAGIYTVIDAKESQSNQYPNQNFINKINLEYFGGVLSRTGTFDLEKVSPTGTLSIFEHFAICIFIYFLFLCTSLLYQNFSFSQDIDFLNKCRARGAKVSAFIFAKFFASFVIFLFVMAVFVIVLSIKVGCESFAVALMASVCTAFLFTAVTTFIYNVFKTATTAILANFLFASFSLFVAGGIVPVAFLPKFITDLKIFSPIYHMENVLACGFTDNGNFVVRAFVCLGIGVLCLGVVLLATIKRIKTEVVNYENV